MFTVSLYKNHAFKSSIWQEPKWDRTVYLAKLTQLENSGVRIPIQVWLTPKSTLWSLGAFTPNRICLIEKLHKELLPSFCLKFDKIGSQLEW